MAEELKGLRQDLVQLQEKLNREVGLFLDQLEFGTDPLSVLTGDKGRWLLANPFISTGTLLQKIVGSVSAELYRGSDESFYVTGASYDKEERELTLKFSDGPNSEHLVVWKVFQNKVSVPDWDIIWKERTERDRLRTELKEKEELLDETRIITSSPDALLANGYLNLYYKRAFRKKAYQKEVSLLLEELEGEVAETRSILEERRKRDLSKMEDERILSCLDQLQLQFLRFPRYRSYKEYTKDKEVKISE